MPKTALPFSRILTRRDFLRGSTALLASVSALKSVPAFGLQTVSSNISYTSIIENIKQLLPVAMASRGITGASKEACAMGYLGKRPVPIANGIVMPLIAAGGLFTSANDLARFVFYLMRGSADAGEQIVPQRLLQEMYAPQFTARDQMSGYGLGIYKAIQLRLDPYSANEFTRGSRRYKFLLAENGKPKGVQIFDAYYDPQTAENSVVYLPVNDMAADGPGLNKPAWSRHVGKYGGTFIGCSQRCQDLAEKRFFVLKWRTETNRSQSQFFHCR